ncbi:MAG: pyruvate kinase [Rhodobacteraceae bacterium]|nr:pyruvate kinase [Paracoccaceae bacterium]
MKRSRSLKIVATLGPASSSLKMIRRMFNAGVDVFRLNMSHGDHDTVRKLHSHIRTVEEEAGRPIGILVDLQGPKLRCGSFANSQETLLDGQQFRIDLDPADGDSTRVHVPHKEIFQVLEPGLQLLVNDGKIRLRVIQCGSDFADCEVVEGGEISSHKGINLPDAIIPLAALSEKDTADLEFACELGVDWLALSFVQQSQDVEIARFLTRGRVAIMTKIEKPAAVARFSEILEVSDGIMIARGDLGVELPIHTVPPIQKRLVRRCRTTAKPVIVATQMLESMIETSTPTRAEVSDVAAAIYEGADAVMLSAESAVGRYPVESVATMDNVAISAESDPTYREIMDASRGSKLVTVADAIAAAAREIAETTDVKAICCFTHTGTTAQLAAREKPRVPIVVLTPFKKISRRLSLQWGAHCVTTQAVLSFDEAVKIATSVACSQKFGSMGDQIIITAGVPFNVSGSTNIVQVAKIGVS